MMRIASFGHAAFAAVMIGLGIQGLVTHELTAVWQPISNSVPGREMLTTLCAVVSLATGVGLLFARTAALSARVLWAYMLIWTLRFRLPVIFRMPGAFPAWDGCAEQVVMLAGSWVLYAWFASAWDRLHVSFATGDHGVPVARVLYGLSMIPFGLAHFIYIQHTAELVPGWLPAPVAWGYFFGGTFIAAGAGILFGVYARLAAALSVVQIGLFTFLVWPPILFPGTKNPYDWVEFVTSIALTAAGWVVTDSYRGVPWLAVRKGQGRGE